MNITHVLLNNSILGKISKEQRSGEFKVWETNLHNPDFSEFAKFCGGQGVRVTNIEGLDSALEEALNHPGPVLVEIMSDGKLI